MWKGEIVEDGTGEKAGTSDTNIYLSSRGLEATPLSVVFDILDIVYRIESSTRLISLFWLSCALVARRRRLYLGSLFQWGVGQ